MRQSCSVPRLIVSSYQGKAGKTTATISLYAALTKAGYRVSLFKVGPDFIDPSYHAAVSGRPGRNLDHFLMGEGVVERFCRYSAGSDLALIEGVHSLYDSMDGYSEEGSTAQIAKLLKGPVLLVINGERVNRTAAAAAMGMKAFEPQVKLVGAFLTNVTENQAEKMSKPLEGSGTPVVGILYRSQQVLEAMGYRHLGLSHMQEREASTLGSVTAAKSSIDTKRVFALAEEASEPVQYEPSGIPEVPPCPKPRIGVASGRAFSFNYPETIEEASRLGDVKFFDPETDQGVDADIVIMGGGFPEVYAEELGKNRPMKAAIRKFVEGSGVLYAECGGLLYLSRKVAYKGTEHEMVGIFDAVGTFHERRVGHGYVWGRLERDALLGRTGTELRGHEFHYTELSTPLQTAFRYDRGAGINGRDGLTYKNAYAHFMHLHPATYDFIGRLVDRTRQ